MSEMNDGFDDFDDFDAFDSFEDDDNFGEPEKSLSPDQQRKLDKFQANVKQATKVVSSDSASVENRVKAARWLGESGEPTAITALRQAYMNASDKKVKKAAGDSLGMFRALEKALADPEKATEVNALLEDIVFQGRMGSVSGASRLLKRLQGLLVVSFVLLMVVGVLANTGVLSGGSGVPTIAPSPTPFLSPTPLPTVAPNAFLGDLLTMHDDLTFDAVLLAERFQLSIQGVGIGCDVTTFRDPSDYFPPTGFNPADYPLVNDFINRLNTARSELASLRVAYDDACSTSVPISAEDANAKWTELTALQTRLNTEFVPLLENPDFIPGEIIATPTARPTVTPFPTPTIEPSVINQIILEITFEIDDMNRSITGKNNRLIQFWTDLEIGGRTDGCRDGAPLLPDDYAVEEEQLTDLPQDLQNAIDAYNLGMALSRESWNLFESACLQEEPATQHGKTQAQLAQTSFVEALASLDLLTGES